MELKISIIFAILCYTLWRVIDEWEYEIIETNRPSCNKKQINECNKKKIYQKDKMEMCVCGFILDWPHKYPILNGIEQAKKKKSHPLNSYHY